jgi:ATP-dependent RNA helicase MSS116, mitochondrial
VGLTDREQYVHRIGRTGRAGKGGAGLLLLADFEAPLLRELADMPLVPAGNASTVTGGTAAGFPPIATTVGGAGAGSTGGAGVITAPIPPVAALTRALGRLRTDEELHREACQAYSAWLGFYKGHLRRVRWDAERMVAEANALFLSLGLPEVPLMPRDTLGKMGLRGVKGIREGPAGWKPGRD